LTQEQVAERLQTLVYNLENWEQNCTAPTIQYFPKIIEFLGYIPWEMSARTLGERIIAHRKLSGLTQRQLAHKIGVHPCTIISWEEGTRKPDKKRLKRLAAFLIESGLPRLSQPPGTADQKPNFTRLSQRIEIVRRPL